jgi:quinol monooxygenase YgiN
LFGLSVRFTCKDESSAQAYDRLVAETLEGIRAHEPGTLVYATHTVEGQPLQRIFYELYRDKAAFEAHEEAPHTRRVSRRARKVPCFDRSRLADLAGR